MYLKYFNFNRKPFATNTDPDFFYPTVSVRKVYDQMSMAIRQQEPYVLLTGNPGTGKTVLLRHMMADTNLKVHWIYIDLAMEFSDEVDCSDDVLNRVMGKIDKFYSKAIYPTIILDEANRLDNDTLQKLLKWQTSNLKKSPAFTIVFADIRKERHTAFYANDGIFATHLNNHFDLEVLNYQETCAVINYRLLIANYNGPALFEADALRLIHKLSGGILREIDNICDLGLFLTAHNRQQVVTRQFIQKASKYLFVNKDTHVGEDLSDEFPLIDLSSASPAQARPGWQVSIWRPAFAGLLIILSGGTWFLMRSITMQMPQEISPPSASLSSSNDAIETTKITADFHQEAPPNNTQVLAQQPTPAPHSKELQAKRDVSNSPKMKVSTVLSQSQKPVPSVKIHTTTIKYKTQRILPTTNNTQKGDRTINFPKGIDLITAAENGNQKEVQHLLDNGVNVNSVNDIGETALMKAAWAGHTNILTLLLNHEPRIDQKSPEGWTALFYGAVKGHKLVVAALLTQGAKPDMADLDGQTSLMAATWNGHSEVARILLHHGADPSIRNNEGETCAQLAAYQGYAHFVSLLSSHNKP